MLERIAFGRIPTPVSPMMMYLNRYAYDIEETDSSRKSDQTTALH
jgi:hypothetical protein